MSDMLLGICGLAVFLVVVFVAGYFYYKFQNARLTGAWGPLVGLVNGKVTGDGGGGTSSTLRGTYQGRPVVATLAPNLNVLSTNNEISGAKINYFDVALTGVAGRYDWAVDFGRSVLGVGQSGWRVETKDSALQAALEAAGVVDLVAANGQPSPHMQVPPVRYSSGTRTLTYSTDITPAKAPAPQQFGLMVDFLAKLAEINARVNPPLA